MTYEEAFEKIWNGLKSQGFEKSVDNEISTRCMYRSQTPDGKPLKCAAGWLIPDEDYDPQFEDKTIEELIELELLPEEFCEEDFYSDYAWRSFLNDMQSAHDIAETQDEMKRRLIKAGIKHTTKSAVERITGEKIYA